MVKSHSTKLILMRHGQSKWNELNLFTGWVDIPLSDKGIDEAILAGKKVKDIPIDIIFTSSLVRAQMTAMLVMAQHSSGKVPLITQSHDGKFENWAKIHSKEAQESCIPVVESWHLNERMYGDLQGLNKKETMDKYGVEQVQIWRRSYDVPPPNGESLKMTAARTIPYFLEEIVPQLKLGKNVFVSAHGNSLRSIIMQLDQLSPEQVVKLELATGEPILYEYHDGVISRCEKG